MANKSSNSNLHKARNSKKDEYYTQLSDIDKELKYYRNHFKDKVVYCNCDDPRVSNFFHFFSYNFEKLGLKKLIATCYKSQDVNLFSTNKSDAAVYLEYTGDKNNNHIPDIEEIGVQDLNGDGDFRSLESIELLKQADIVVTNPPFSLFREYISQLMEYEKKFLIVGNINAISLKECFEWIKDDKMWLGYNTLRHFKQPDGSMYETARSFWYTNLDIKKKYDEIILYKTYIGNENDYPEFDNYNAINVNKTSDIPLDYNGYMAVPITFLDKYNHTQFEIISCNDIRRNESIPFKSHGLIKDKDSAINGKPTYVRIVIKRR
jgi:hypothetical protein